MINSRRIPSRYTFSVTSEGLVCSFFESNAGKWQELLGFVKAFKGARFDRLKNKWIVPDTEQNQTLLTMRGFNLVETKKVKDVEVVVAKKVSDAGTRPLPWVEYELDKSRVPAYLRPYQVDGLKFLDWRGDRGGLVADQMGVGKTIQAIGYLDYTRIEPVLLVVTASTKLQWEGVLRQFLPWFDFQTIWGTSLRELPKKSVLINWDILLNWAGEIKSDRFYPTGPLSKIPFKLVIGDEIQAIGGHSSNRTKAFRKLCKMTGRGPIGLSGTPIQTRPQQFYDILALISPQVFNNHMKFQYRYCGPHHNGFQMTFKGATNMDELFKLIRPCMIRRLRNDVFKDMPQMTVSVVPMEVKNMGAYESAEREAFAPVSASRSLKDIEADVQALRLSAYQFKRESVVRWITEMLEKSEEKFIVFCWHKSVVELLMEDLKAWNPALVNGSITGMKRKEQIDRFKEDPECRLIVGNITALGVGVDGLQNVCWNTITVEFAAAPTMHDQAESRVDRSGQKMPTNSYYLVAKGTIDEEQMKTLDSRRKMMDKILDGKDANCDDFLTTLLKNHGCVV